MTAAVKEIIERNRKIRSRVSDFQKKRIAELQKRVERQRRGETVDSADVFKRWQKIGIIDQNGELTSPYRQED